MFVTLGVLVILFIYHLALGKPFLEALGTAGAAAVAVFLSWAVSREIDPVYEWSAFISLPFTITAFLLYGQPALAALFFILLLGRLINGSTGLKATPIDAALLTILGTVLFTGGTLIALPFLAAAFGLIGILYAPAPDGRRHGLYALLSLALFIIMFIFFYPQHYFVPGFSIYTGVAALALAFFTVVLVLRAGKGLVSGDNNEEALDDRRIRLAQVGLALFMITDFYLKGSIALVMLYPAIFAYLGTAAYNLLRRP